MIIGGAALQWQKGNLFITFYFRCHWCHKLGHKKSQCPNYYDRQGPAKPVRLVLVRREAGDNLEGSEGFISSSAESLHMPVTILRDTGAKQTLLRKSVMELLSSTFTGQFAVVQAVSGGY